MLSESLVAADAGVVAAAAFVPDGDDVAIRVPVRTLCETSHLQAMDDGYLFRGSSWRGRGDRLVCCSWRLGFRHRDKRGEGEVLDFLL